MSVIELGMDRNTLSWGEDSKVCLSGNLGFTLPANLEALGEVEKMNFGKCYLVDGFSAETVSLESNLSKIVFKGAHISLARENEESAQLRQTFFVHERKQVVGEINAWLLLDLSGRVSYFFCWEQLKSRNVKPFSLRSGRIQTSGDEAGFSLRRPTGDAKNEENHLVDVNFISPAPGRPATITGDGLPITTLHFDLGHFAPGSALNYFERLWDTSSMQLLDFAMWEQNLQDFVKQVVISFLLIEDSISGVCLELEKQTIYLESANLANEKMNAHQLAKRICSGMHGGNFDRELAGQINKGVLTIADAGSGKSWMTQQVALAICQLFERSDSDFVSDFVPMLLPVQSIFGSVGENVIETASSDIETFLYSFLEAKESIMGVKLRPAMRLSLMQALRARRYGRGGGRRRSFFSNFCTSLSYRFREDLF
jgi:hypothetical protein